jgi:hypothetical protein
MTAALATSDNGCFVGHINSFLLAAFFLYMIAHVRRTQLTNHTQSACAAFSFLPTKNPLTDTGNGKWQLEKRGGSFSKRLYRAFGLQ